MSAWGVRYVLEVPIFAITLSVVFGTAALADNSSQPSDSIIVHTVQCEAGRAGAYLVANGFSANLKVSVSWTSKKDPGLIVRYDSQIFSYRRVLGSSRQDIDQLMSNGLSFNLNPANLEVCNGYKKDILQEGVGLYDCLINQKLESFCRRCRFSWLHSRSRNFEEAQWQSAAERMGS